MTVAVEIAATQINVVSKPEPKGVENQEPENQPEPLPDSMFQDEAIAEQKLKKHILKQKLKVSVAVANGCHHALERERMDTREETTLLRFPDDLLLGREALKKSINNPLGVGILHTPEEAHELIAEKERKQKDGE